LENKRDPEKNPRSLYPVRFALAPAGVPGLGASPGVWVTALGALTLNTPTLYFTRESSKLLSVAFRNSKYVGFKTA
jgi:hypothetical protein